MRAGSSSSGSRSPISAARCSTPAAASTPARRRRAARSRSALEAQRLDGVAALAARFAPGCGRHAADADAARRLGQAHRQARRRASLGGRRREDLGQAHGRRRDRRRAGQARWPKGNGDTASPATADIRLDGRLEADEGRRSPRWSGSIASPWSDQRPARVTLRRTGRPAAICASTPGSTAPASTPPPAARCSLADAHPRGVVRREPRRPPMRGCRAATRASPMPVTLAHAGVARRRAARRSARSTAGSPARGSRASSASRSDHPTRVEGRLEADTIDAAAVIAAAIGARRRRRRDGPWSSEPFVAGPLADVEGHLEFAVAQATLRGRTSPGGSCAAPCASRRRPSRWTRSRAAWPTDGSRRRPNSAPRRRACRRKRAGLARQCGSAALLPRAACGRATRPRHAAVRRAAARARARPR